MSKTMFERVTFRVEASWVKRYHTRQTLTTETLGQHGHTVATLVQQVYPECSKKAILAALEHDLPEFVTGDTPAPAKWASADLDQALSALEAKVIVDEGLYSCTGLTDGERELLKWADMMALVLYCLQEVRMGNTTLRSTLATGIRVCQERAAAMYAANEQAASLQRTTITVNVQTFMSQLLKGIQDVYASAH